MTNHKTITKQLTFTDEISRRKKQRQERCRHLFIEIPIGSDEKIDEVYKIYACKICGYSDD